MELIKSTSYGGFSVRGILSFVAAVILTAFLATILGTPASAQAADANWSGATIVYDGHGYNQTTEFNDTTNTIPSGATVYIAPIQNVEGSTSAKKALVLFFSPGVDPPTATTVSYAEFDYDTANKSLSNATNKKDVKITVRGDEIERTSCSVSGIGWILCPISVYLAEMMDNFFEFLSGMIAVQPSVLGDPNNSMYVAWNVMRNIANVAFVIVFLIIIYSQLTSWGVSNYGLKKLLPRLIIAAVLVNLSFIVAAVAIDASNILGYSIQNVFNVIREDLFHITEDTFGSGISSPWTSVTAIILAGGGVIGGIYYLSSAGLYFLVPILIGLALTLLLVIIVLAARQAIIIILVIIAPLAFVANLLPNTEKWFDKWKDLFITMLIFFPAFSLVFGGSQLAGQLIIQNAGDNIVMLLFGLAVQVAPLVITPLILKFSGGLLGRIAQITNNPSKGLLDRNKNWAKDRSELHKQRVLGRDLSKASNLSPRTWTNRAIKSTEFRKRRLKDNIAAATTTGDNEYHKTSAYDRIHERAELAGMDKERIEAKQKAHSHKEMNRVGTKLHTSMVELEGQKAKLDVASLETDTIKQNYRAGEFTLPTTTATKGPVFDDLKRLGDVQKEMAKNVILATAEKRAAESALHVQQVSYAEAMQKNVANFANGKSLQTIAGGIDKNGSQRALASALALIEKARKETIDNTKVIISDKNLTGADLTQLALGKKPQGVDITMTQDVQAAALQMTFGGADTNQIVQALRDVDLSFAGKTKDEATELRVIVADALMANSSRPPFFTAGAAANMRQGQKFNSTPEAPIMFTGAYGSNGLNEMILSTVGAQKIDSGKLQTAGKDYVVALRQALEAGAGGLTADARTRLFKELETTLDPQREASEKLGDSKQELEKIRDLLR